MQRYFVYIMANRTKTLYIGVTNDLERRVAEHKLKVAPGFTSKYNITTLVWYEDFYDIDQAIAAEKKLKGWRRSKKIALVEQTNPEWRDLAAQLNELLKKGAADPSADLGVTTSARQPAEPTRL